MRTPYVWLMAGACMFSVVRAGDRDAQDWPRWRGPTATGHAPRANPPTEWSETKNVRWKVEIPGSGHASPIVWGDRVFLTTAIRTEREAEPKKRPEEEGGDAGPNRGAKRSRRGSHGRFGGRRAKPTHIHEFVVMALDRATGKTLWQKTAAEALPHEAGHRDSTQASASPVTDGRRLIAHFGSRGIFCFDLDGHLKWSKDLGDMTTRNRFGEGSSPVLHGDTVVVNWDHEGPSFVVALNADTGDVQWKKDRDEVTSWSTPIVVDVGGKPQVIVSATGRVRGYDLKTGAVVWACGGQTTNTIPSPVFADGFLYAMSGFRGSTLRAIRLAGAAGDISDSPAVAWRYDQDTPYVPSPLLAEDMLYFFKGNRPILTCLDARNGKPYFSGHRLEGLGGIYASPVGTADRVYICDREGNTMVLKRATEVEILTVNELDDGFDSSPAVSGNDLFLRGRHHLYCISRTR